LARWVALASAEHTQCLDNSQQDESGDASADYDPLLFVLSESGKTAENIAYK